MDYFSSLWFKSSLIISIFVFACGLVTYFKVAQKDADQIPDVEKLRLKQLLPKAMIMCKIVLVVLPIYLFLIPSINGLDSRLSYQILFGLTVMYASSIDGYILFRRLLSNLGK